MALVGFGPGRGINHTRSRTAICTLTGSCPCATTAADCHTHLRKGPGTLRIPHPTGRNRNRPTRSRTLRIDLPGLPDKSVRSRRVKPRLVVALVPTLIPGLIDAVLEGVPALNAPVVIGATILLLRGIRSAGRVSARTILDLVTNTLIIADARPAFFETADIRRFAFRVAVGPALLVFATERLAGFVMLVRLRLGGGRRYGQNDRY